MSGVRQLASMTRMNGNGADEGVKIDSRVEIPVATTSGKSLAQHPTTQDWLIWQLADSAFPTGGFAHSSGLEAAWQHGEIRNRTELISFIEAALYQFGHCSLPLMNAAHKQPAQLAELDDLCQAFLSNHVANRASRLQGQAMLASARRIFRLAEMETLNPPHGHLAPVFGAVTAVLEIGREAAACLFLFTHLRGLIAAAVRLGIAGPMEAQALQHELAAPSERILERSMELSIDDIAQTAPLQEIWQGAQDRLYSRLFQS